MRLLFDRGAFQLGLTRTGSPTPLNKSQQLCLPLLLTYSRLHLAYFFSPSLFPTDVVPGSYLVGAANWEELRSTAQTYVRLC